jgi:hypothetical protein
MFGFATRKELQKALKRIEDLEARLRYPESQKGSDNYIEWEIIFPNTDVNAAMLIERFQSLEKHLGIGYIKACTAHVPASHCELVTKKKR